MSEEKIIGIVTKVFDYEDTSQIVTVLTNTEVISFIALGVRKITSKNRIAIQVGNIIDATIFRARLTNKLSKLKKAVLIKQPPISKSNTAKVVLEFINYLAKIKEPSNDLLNSIISAYEQLGGINNHKVRTYIIFQTLSSFGIKSILNQCVECGGFENIYAFEFYKGGFICNKHNVKKRPLDFLKAIQALDKSIDQYINTCDLIDEEIYKELTTYISSGNYI